MWRQTTNRLLFGTVHHRRTNEQEVKTMRVEIGENESMPIIFSPTNQNHRTCIAIAEFDLCLCLLNYVILYTIDLQDDKQIR